MSEVDTVWTDDLVARLDKMRRAGHSMSRISQTLGVSRDAVLGKVYRLRQKRTPLIDQRIQRRARILKMHEAGKRPCDIADRVNLSTRMVRIILEEAGIAIGEPPPDYERSVHRMWSMDEAERRDAIARHAAAGARDTRAANTPAFPRNSHPPKTALLDR